MFWGFLALSSLISKIPTLCTLTMSECVLSEKCVNLVASGLLQALKPNTGAQQLHLVSIDFSGNPLKDVCAFTVLFFSLSFCLWFWCCESFRGYSAFGTLRLSMSCLFPSHKKYALVLAGSSEPFKLLPEEHKLHFLHAVSLMVLSKWVELAAVFVCYDRKKDVFCGGILLRREAILKTEWNH